MLTQPWYNFFQTVTDKVLFATFPKMRTFQFSSRCRPNHQDRVKISSLIQTPGSNVSNPGLPEPENRFSWLFSSTRNPFFFKRGYFKKLELLLHSNISNSDNNEVEEWRVQRPN